MDAGIRAAELADVPAIRHILVATWHDTYDETLGPDSVRDATNRWHSAELLRRRLEHRVGLTLVGLRRDQIIATAHGIRRDNSLLWLSQLYVLPEHQRGGLGAALLERLIAAHPGVLQIELEVEKANAKAVGFYVGAGFSAIAERKHCLGELPVPTLHLRCVLSSRDDAT